MSNPFDQLDETISQEAGPRRELAEVLEKFLADLEEGAPADRDALLAAHPALADELRPYLDGLMRLHAATQGLRSAGFPNAFPGTKSSAGGSDQRGSSTQPGNKQIGDYRIVREIGRGGMGVVYEAHQVSLNRRVALKILPFAAVLDQRQIARFRNEAQAAAQLHHPHIVPVFAVGQEHGVYYYAMQYIDGKSLEEAMNELRAGAGATSEHSTRARGAAHGSTATLVTQGGAVLSSAGSIRTSDFFRSVARLGKEAAEALQHAHEYGIIHRDVKPSNLLVDLQGKLWVTDFGLARIQAGSGVTLTGDVVGTLRYMSPEQASGQAGLVDSRTDVYSLGVTLYELLTLEHAFPGDDRQLVLRRLERDEPIAPRRHNPAVPADLETIVLAAMSKSRDERYASAQALADDLGRFLAGEPTHARRPGLVDRAAKWAKRHRAMVSLAAASVVLLSIVSTVGMVLLAHARQTAEDNAKAAAANFTRAEKNFLQAQDVVDQFGVKVAEQLLATPGTEPVRRRLLTDTLRYYQEFAAQAADDPKLQHELALAHFKSGVIAAKLGDAAAAVSEYNAAEKLLAELVVAEAKDPELKSQLALVHNNLAILAAARGDVSQAQAEYEQAIQMQRRLVALNANEPAYAGQLAESLSNLGMLFDSRAESQSKLGNATDSRRDAAAAERCLTESVALLRPLVVDANAEPRYARNLSIAANNLSYVLAKHDPAAAERASREAIAILERLTLSQPRGEQFQDDLALCYNNLGALLSRGSHFDEAAQWHQRAAALQEQLARKAPAIVRYRSDLATSLNNLGVTECRAGRVDDSDAPFAKARELFTTLADDYPDESAYRSSLAALLNNQGLALAEAGRHDRAVEIYPDAIAAERECWQRSPGNELLQQLLSKMVYNYGQSLTALGRWDDAVSAAAERRDIWKDNGDRLFGVAAELAGIRHALDEKSEKNSADPHRQKIDDQTVATLRQALDNGWRGASGLNQDERFSHLRGQEQFAKLTGEASP